MLMMTKTDIEIFEETKEKVKAAYNNLDKDKKLIIKAIGFDLDRFHEKVFNGFIEELNQDDRIEKQQLDYPDESTKRKTRAIIKSKKKDTITLYKFKPAMYEVALDLAFGTIDLMTMPDIWYMVATLLTAKEVYNIFKNAHKIQKDPEISVILGLQKTIAERRILKKRKDSIESIEPTSKEMIDNVNELLIKRNAAKQLSASGLVRELKKLELKGIVKSDSTGNAMRWELQY